MAREAEPKVSHRESQVASEQEAEKGFAEELLKGSTPAGIHDKRAEGDHHQDRAVQQERLGKARAPGPLLASAMV
jgi:hypothetical protein